MTRVLITGASSGIGRATAIELAERGHEVIATARDVTAIEDLPTTERLALDVTHERSITDAVVAAGRVDAIVNNAAVGLSGPTETVPLVDVQTLFDVNVFGPVRLIQAFLPAMRARGAGTIVNVSSIAGRVAGPLTGFYSATKRALEAVSEGLHFEVGHFGIRVVVIEPGLVATGFHTRTHHHGDDIGPYDELRESWSTAEARIVPGMSALPPAVVARAIAGAIEDDHTPFRVLLGVDAQLIAAARRSLDDASFEQDLRTDLRVDW
jgi:NADP-dependent 3-hydroxy acid dehydrogenase YdfG